LIKWRTAPVAVGRCEEHFSYTGAAGVPLRCAQFMIPLELTMLIEHAADRIAIDGKIHCRSEDGEDWIVLRWRRQIDEAASGQPARWVDVGPAVFTLLDSSAVIQISGSALQVVGTGMVLRVVDDVEDADVMPVPIWAGAAAAQTHARSSAAMS
jgi:hypothetical protein